MESKTVAEVIESLKQSGRCACDKITRALGMIDEAYADCRSLSCEECRAKWLGILADMIEREKSEAVSAAMERTMAEQLAEWAKESGLPPFRDGEGFGEWLDRCFLLRPRYEDGEPVQFSDKTADGDSVRAFTLFQSGAFNVAYEEGPSVCHVPGGTVDRPAPEVLGADGLTIEVGDMVYEIETGLKSEVISTTMLDSDGNTVCCKDNCIGELHYKPEELTHTPPDTQERIDADALLDFEGYWKCEDKLCGHCPSEIDGKNPHQRYGTNGDCEPAMHLDLLRRQRELDARKGGA